MATISASGTTKQKPRLEYEGHFYVRDRSTSEKIYWRCIKFSTQHCRSRLHTCIFTNNIIKPPTEHSCRFDGTALELYQFDQRLVNRAKNTQETPDIIINNCIRGMSDQAITRLPIRDNIKRRIRQLRANDNLEAIPNDPNFISIPTILYETHRKSQFLRSDTGPGDDRILIFASNEQLAILRSARHFMSDGTFKIVPEIFYQLYIIHAVYRDHVLPVCYALLRRKDASTYDRLFNEILKFAPEWSPDSMMIDYEKACINSYQSTFPDAQLSGCYFYLKQSLHRKLQSLGCQTRYQTDSVFAHNIHKVGALAFLQTTDVITGFEALSLSLDDDYQDIIDYFEETYIGRLRPNGTRRKPMFDIEFWNMHCRTTQCSMRTNNSAEANHRRIGSVFQCSHPTLWVFLQKLIDEETSNHADILQVKAGQPPKHKKKNQRFETRLLNLISTPHSDILTQIDSIAHNITL